MRSRTPLADAYKDTLIAKASDWVTKLCLGVYMLYGCAKCHVYPLESNRWFRFCWIEKEKGKTYTKDGPWRCTSCLHKWTWPEGGTQRMLVAGSPEDDEVFCSYVGTVPADLELHLGLLKTSTLLEDVKGKEVTKERILEAIRKLNDEVSGRLGQFLKTKSYKAQNPSDASSVPIYCENPRLSLEVPGLDCKAFPLPEGFDPEPLTRNDLQLFIAFAASFLDMNQVTQPREGTRSGAQESLAGADGSP